MIACSHLWMKRSTPVRRFEVTQRRINGPVLLTQMSPQAQKCQNNLFQGLVLWFQGLIVWNNLFQGLGLWFQGFIVWTLAFRIWGLSR